MKLSMQEKGPKASGQ